MSSGIRLPIKYRDYYDIPRAVVVEYEGNIYLFDCPFDSEIDEYGGDYHIYRLSSSFRHNLDDLDWSKLSEEGEQIGRVPVEMVEFDSTKRKYIDSEVLQEITSSEREKR